MCVSSAALHTSSQRLDLNEFFDKKENWAEPNIRVGRPYTLDELRLKSNTDLHKLWYVLLKERNMLMTMAEEYKREVELFPNPDRLEKVEDSMENLLDVIRERDVAVSLLETGETPPQVRKRWTNNRLGIGFWKKFKEYPIPIHMNMGMKRTLALTGPWMQKYKRLYREKRLRQRGREMRSEMGKALGLREVFRENKDVRPDLERFEKTMAATLMKGPDSRSEH